MKFYREIKFFGQEGGEMETKEEIKVAALVIIRPDGRMLLVREGDEAWTLPTEKFEADKDLNLEDAAWRGAKEELFGHVHGADVRKLLRFMKPLGFWLSPKKLPFKQYVFEIFVFTAKNEVAAELVDFFEAVRGEVLWVVATEANKLEIDELAKEGLKRLMASQIYLRAISLIHFIRNLARRELRRWRRIFSFCHAAVR